VSPTDRIEVHGRSCKGLQGGLKPWAQQQPPITAVHTGSLTAVNTSSLSAIPTAIANVELLLSTPLTIRRQLHSQTDAVVVNSSSPLHQHDEVDKSQSD
jgi:hypothetical protein